MSTEVLHQLESADSVGQQLVWLFRAMPGLIDVDNAPASRSPLAPIDHDEVVSTLKQMQADGRLVNEPLIVRQRADSQIAIAEIRSKPHELPFEKQYARVFHSPWQVPSPPEIDAAGEKLDEALSKFGMTLYPKKEDNQKKYEDRFGVDLPWKDLLRYGASIALDGADLVNSGYAPKVELMEAAIVWDPGEWSGWYGNKDSQHVKQLNLRQPFNRVRARLLHNAIEEHAHEADLSQQGHGFTSQAEAILLFGDPAYPLVEASAGAATSIELAELGQLNSRFRLHLCKEDYDELVMSRALAIGLSEGTTIAVEYAQDKLPLDKEEDVEARVRMMFSDPLFTLIRASYYAGSRLVAPIVDKPDWTTEQKRQAVSGLWGKARTYNEYQSAVDTAIAA